MLPAPTGLDDAGASVFHIAYQTGWFGLYRRANLRVGETLHGPIGRGTRAVRDVVLEPKAIAEAFAVVVDVPEVISQTIGVVPAEEAGAVAIR